MKSKASARIFISYAHNDSRQVEQIYQFLKANSHRPWMDVHDIIGGEDWQRAIRKSIRESDIFLFCLSTKSYNRRGMIQRELRLGQDEMTMLTPGDIYLIPLRLEECSLPETLESYQAIDWFAADGQQRLLVAIQAAMARRKF